MRDIRNSRIYAIEARKHPTLADREARLGELDRQITAALNDLPQDKPLLRRLARRRQAILHMILNERQPGLL
jgi:hypothetical protein